MRRFAAALAFALTACASTPRGDGSTALSHRRDVITAEEIQATKRPGGTAWDVVSSIRPQFLNSRGPTSFRSSVSAGPIVYLDGARYGEVESLKTINADLVQRIEFMSGPNATTRYGTDHAAGAILILTR